MSIPWIFKLGACIAIFALLGCVAYFLTGPSAEASEVTRDANAPEIRLISIY